MANFDHSKRDQKPGSTNPELAARTAAAEQERERIMVAAETEERERQKRVREQLSRGEPPEPFVPPKPRPPDSLFPMEDELEDEIEDEPEDEPISEPEPEPKPRIIRPRKEKLKKPKNDKDQSDPLLLLNLEQRLARIERNQAGIATVIHKMADLQLNAYERRLHRMAEWLSAGQSCTWSGFTGQLRALHQDLVERLDALFEEQTEQVNEPASRGEPKQSPVPPEPPEPLEPPADLKTKSLGELCETLFVKTTGQTIAVSDEERAMLGLVYEQTLSETYGDSREAIDQLMNQILDYVAKCRVNNTPLSVKEFCNSTLADRV